MIAQPLPAGAVRQAEGVAAIVTKVFNKGIQPRIACPD